MAAEPLPTIPDPQLPYDPADCPATPKEPTPEALGFTPRKRMVNWLGPLQLLDTGIKALLSSIFGSYADKREVQAAIAQKPWQLDYSGHEPLWLDYVADLGDGFNPTYTVAWLLSRETLTPAGASEPLPRAHVLLMGGDQVYPTASSSEYEDRLVGPYRAAMPWSRRPAAPLRHPRQPRLVRRADQLPAPLLPPAAALDRRLGDPPAAQLLRAQAAAGWWLWGTDIQLTSDIDRPQLDYFEEVAAEMRKQANESGQQQRVILVTAEPNWVLAAEHEPGQQKSVIDPEAFEKLAYFEQHLIRGAAGARLALVLSGDLHHYCRYEQIDGDETPPTHRITSGGGGAYLFGTHQMPQGIRLSEGDGGKQDVRHRYQRRGVFPALKDSIRLTRRVWGLPWRNFSFSMLLGSVYLLFAWVLQSASKANNELSATLLETIADQRPSALAGSFLKVFAHSPASTVFLVVIVAGLWAFTASQKSTSKPLLHVLGALHAVAHLLLCFALMRLIAWFHLRVLELDVDRLWQVVLFALEMFFVGGFFGSVLFAAHMLITSRLTCAHTGEIFSSQRIQDYKSFLRMRIDKSTGDLSLFPIGVEKVPRRWTFNPQAKNGEPWWNPPDGDITAQLIEGPITIR